MELTSDLSTFSVLLIGFVLGLRHAMDADHLAAVSTIVSEKKDLLTASLVGGLWGVGHTISLFAVGLVVILLKLQISESVEATLEACVGFMLVILGLNAFRKIFQAKKIHVHTHEHDGHTHTHIHSHQFEESEESHHRFSPRSVLIGMVHGLAGSAALMFLILPTIESPVVALVYILIFGIGSIGGMVAMSLLIGLPFHFTAQRFDYLNKGIRLCAGLFSFGLGLVILYEKVLSA
jgi:sulfite exporter TauE/SafE